MRLLAALIYIFFGLWVFSKFGIDFSTDLIIPAFFFLMLSSVVIFNEGFIRKLRGISYEEHIHNLVEKGKAHVEKYNIFNSAVFEDLNTGCIAYLLDIGDRKILVLYGQGYIFEPIYDDPDMNQNRLFPTESFSLIREIKNKYIHEVTPIGKVIEPIIIEAPKIENLADFGFKLEDGEIVENVNFDEVINVLQP